MSTEGSAGVALVTGAARGIGAASVRALALAGFAIVATDRCADDPRLPYALGSREELDAVVAEIVAAGGEAVAVTADTTDPDALAAAVHVARRTFGGLDAVVAAAGAVAGGVPLWQMPEAQVQAMLDVNLHGAVTAARVCLPAVLERPQPREGRFVAVASAAATRGLPLLAAYCAAKAGATGLIRGLAAELRGTGVTANAVSPGSTDTAVLAESARLYGLDDPQSFAAQQSIGRLVAPHEVAATIAFLCSPAAAAITGAAVAVDGGLAL
jgi:SDR family mycofactocin-dependent oxidoreductase